MTTIAWDGRVIAADSQSTADNVICSLNEQKIYTPEDDQQWRVNGEEICFFGAAGNCGAEVAIIDAMLEGLNYKTELPEIMEFTAITISKTGKALLLFKGADKKTVSIAPHDGEYAIGSGAIVARTAMNLGCSAIDAVAAAIKMDVYSGGKINSLSLDDAANHSSNLRTAITNFQQANHHKGYIR